MAEDLRIYNKTYVIAYIHVNAYYLAAYMLAVNF